MAFDREVRSTDPIVTFGLVVLGLLAAGVLGFAAHQTIVMYEDF